MVQQITFYKKRENLDLNNINFIANENPIGTNSFGFPIFREITDPLYTQTPWSTTQYKNITSDEYGMFTSFYVRSGVRRFRQNHVELVLEQKTNDFVSPLFFATFFGFRPVIYDPRTGSTTGPPTAPIPIYDHFNLFPTQNMRCNNLHDDFTSSITGSPTDLLETTNAIPPPILYSADSTYHRRHVFSDLAMPIAFKTKSVFSQGAKTFSLHTMASTHEFSLPDINSFPGGIALEAKLHIYCFKAVYFSGVNNNSDPQIFPIPADDIVTFGGYHETI